jgi:hypothetical protein
MRLLKGYFSWHRKRVNEIFRHQLSGRGKRLVIFLISMHILRRMLKDYATLNRLVHTVSSVVKHDTFSPRKRLNGVIGMGVLLEVPR